MKRKKRKKEATEEKENRKRIMLRRGLELGTSELQVGATSRITIGRCVTTWLHVGTL